MRFLIDSMFPPMVVELLRARGHDAVSPTEVGGHNLPDELLIQIASSEKRVIVTENVVDFAHVTTCAVLLVRKSWWARKVMAQRLADAIERWAIANEEPEPWARWLEAPLR